MTVPEEAYDRALVQATELLPANDPMIGQLNTACIEIFKTAFKSVKRSDPEHIQAITSTISIRATDGTTDRTTDRITDKTTDRTTDRQTDRND